MDSVGYNQRMPLSFNEIRARAAKFAKDWENRGDEKSEAGQFSIRILVSRGRLNQRLESAKSYFGSNFSLNKFWEGMGFAQ